MNVPMTERAKRVLLLAEQEARRLEGMHVGTEHLLLGLLKEGCGVASYVLRDLGADVDALEHSVQALVQGQTKHVILGRLPLTPRARLVVNLAWEEAKSLHHDYVGTEHLLLGLCRETESVATSVLIEHGIDLGTVREKVLALFERPDRPHEKLVKEMSDPELFEWLEQQAGVLREWKTPDTVGVGVIVFREDGRCNGYFRRYVESLDIPEQLRDLSDRIDAGRQNE